MTSQGSRRRHAGRQGQEQAVPAGHRSVARRLFPSRGQQASAVVAIRHVLRGETKAPSSALLRCVRVLRGMHACKGVGGAEARLPVAQGYGVKVRCRARPPSSRRNCTRSQPCMAHQNGAIRAPAAGGGRRAQCALFESLGRLVLVERLDHCRLDLLRAQRAVAGLRSGETWDRGGSCSTPVPAEGTRAGWDCWPARAAALSRCCPSATTQPRTSQAPEDRVGRSAPLFQRIVLVLRRRKSSQTGMIAPTSPPLLFARECCWFPAAAASPA